VIRSRVVAWAAGATVVTAIAIALTLIRSEPVRSDPPAPPPGRNIAIRNALFAEIQPVTLANCELERFGEPHDGGYLLCGNLLGAVESGYSYGINGFDGWGCDVSRRFTIPVHQYDCFNTTVPVCEGGRTVFHAECVAGAASTTDGRRFDTVVQHVANNGDTGKHLIVKIDVEGAEWDTFLQMPDELLDRIDQIAIEFHGFGEERFVVALWKLKKFFHLAHLHFNNASCSAGIAPFPAWAYEVLLVNKRLGIVDPEAGLPRQSPLAARNHPDTPDCQAAR